MEADLRDLFPARQDATAQSLLRFSRRRPFQRCQRIVQRCFDLTPAEIGHRLSLLVAGDASAAGNYGLTAISRDSALAALDTNFLFGRANQERTCATLRASAPVIDRLVTSAARIQTSGVEVFGRTIELDPATIDWQRDPRTGRRLWADVRLNESTAVRAARDIDGHAITDVKDVWELNRHQWLTTLALASRLGHAKEVGPRIRDLLAGWIAQNPPDVSVNWASVLEVGVRSISWLWAMSLALDSPELRAVAQPWIDSLADHYEFLRRHLSIYTDRSNHLIGETTALWLLAAVFPELPDADKERRRAQDILAVEIGRQVTSDGVSREQAVGYHCFVLDFFLQVVLVARHQNIPLPPIIESRVVAMLEFLGRLSGAGGMLPQIGDGDDGVGWPFPLPLTARERAETLMAIGAKFFGRPEWQPSAELPRVLAQALVGEVSADTSTKRVDEESSLLLSEGGYCFLEATAPGGERRQLIFDVGGLGYLPNAAHEHADALSILVRVNETLVLGDPGTGTYTASQAIRDGFRGTASHNTVTIDDLDQADMLDTFKWINCFKTRVIGCAFSPRLDRVAAVHEGFDRMRKRMRHGREILFVRPDYWIVVDRVAGTGRHEVARRFHFPPGFAVSQIGPSTFEVAGAESRDGLRFDFPETDGMPTAAAQEIGPWSPGYGRWETSSRLVLRNKIDTSALFLTLITPLHRGHLDRVVVYPEPTTRGAGGGTGDRMENVVCRIGDWEGSPGREDLILRGESGNLTFVSQGCEMPIARTLG